MNNQNQSLPDNPNIKVLKAGRTGLFTNHIFKAIPLAFDESMSYYETLLGLLHYLKYTIIPTVNNNAEAVAELQNLYIELKTYVDDAITEFEEYVNSEINRFENQVDTEINRFEGVVDDKVQSLEDYMNNYFDNLDVQEEINNKLDDMVESGQLEEIISEYLTLAGMITYDTVSDMKLATNLVNGSKCATLGYYTLNDGGRAFYKIRTITNEDVIDEMFILSLDDDTLIAELICDEEINLKQLGLKGDGTTDETTKLQNAFSKTYNIFINNGTYVTNDEITIASPKIVTGDSNAIIIAKQGMAIDKSIIKILSDNVTIKNVKISANITENPIGDTYNSNHGISQIDIVDTRKNITIDSCTLYDNAYGSIRIRGTSTGQYFDNLTFKNNQFNNVDCGIISLSSVDKLLHLTNIYYLNNEFNGYSKSEPISLFHYGTSKNIVITGNIMYNKTQGHAIYITHNTNKQIIISNNNISDCSNGVAIDNGENINIENNIITGISNYINEGIILTDCNNVSVNNNTFDKISNDGIILNNCEYVNVNDNIVTNLNINDAQGFKSAIKINGITHANFSNNYTSRYSTTQSVVYRLMSTCSYLSINEPNNNSITAYGLHISDLTSLTDSYILTNLSIQGGFTANKVDSNTNTIIQNNPQTLTTFNIPYNYKFSRITKYNFGSNQTLSTYQIYNLKDYDVYDLYINTTATLTLTNNTTDDFGITWKSERTITSGTKTIIRLMYINNKLYEV